MPAIVRPAPEQELYGVLGDTEDTYRQLVQKRDSQYLSRYPSFHTSAIPSATGASSSNPKSSPRAAPSSSFEVKRARSRRPEESNRDDADSDEEQDHDDPTNKSWYDQDAEVWKPKNTVSRLTRRPAPPSRPQPAPPVETIPSHSSPTSFAPGILISEPAQKFARVRGPRKSAMKTPKPTVPKEPAPLPSTAYLSPQIAAQRRYAVKQTAAAVLSPPSTVIGSDRSGPGSYMMSPATTHGRLSSAATSHRGSSTGTSSVAFTTTSSSVYSAPSQIRSGPPMPPSRKFTQGDGEPDEIGGSRATRLFVVNADPESSESERSPIKGVRPQFPPVSQKQPVTRQKTREVTRIVPPVPPLPIQFQAPPPPAYPPPGDRSHSDPTVPGLSKSKAKHERSKLGRHSSDNRPGESHARSKPIPIPPQSKHSSGAPASLSHSDSVSSASSRSGSPYTPPQQDTAPIAAADIPPEWIYPLPLTLEELFKGGKYTYRITTRLLSGAPKIQEVEVDVKPGWKSGTRIIFPAAGNERKPGVFQDMIFVVEQVHHERFARLDGGRLVVNQDIDVADALREGVVRDARKVVGLDGNVIQFHPPMGVIRPGKETVVKGQGMWIRSKSKVAGRGDLIIRWNVVFPNQPLTPDQLHRMRDIFH